MARDYHFEDYNPDWVFSFNEIKDLVSSVFQGKAFSIEHVGSTSVPGMRSKPLIDVVVALDPFFVSEDEKAVFEKAGYYFSENKIGEGTILFEKGQELEKTANIHLLPKGHHLVDQMVLSRDYLRSHPTRAEAYGKLKDELKEKYPDDYKLYREGKEAFMQETERLALLEYKRTQF
jgi:GrpB-like predicted nucleotidyltransferase (UPF0157 family)